MAKEKKEKEQKEEEKVKFKPVAPTDLDEEQKKIVTKIEEHWKGDPCVVNDFTNMEEWIEWFYGNQYTEQINGELTDLTPYVEREVKNVYNRTMPTIRQIWGELRYPHEFYGEPATLEKDDIKRAKIASIFIEYSNEAGKFKFKIDMAKLWTLICKCVYWKEWWNSRDSSKYGYTRDSKTNERVKVPGDVDFNFISPFNCRPDPLGTSRETWRHFIEGVRLPKSMVENEFGLEPNDLPAEGKQEEDTLPKHKNVEEYKEDTIIRLEYWEKGTKQRPKGRFIVTAGGWLLYDGDNPAPRYQLPYWRLPGLLPDLRNPGQYESAVKILRALQKQYNRLNSQLDEYATHFGVKAMIPFGSIVGQNLNAFRRAGIEYVVYNSRFGQPYYQNTPSLPDSIVNRVAHVEKEFDTVISVRKPTMAQWEKGVRASNVLFESFKRQDEIVLMPTVEEYDNILPEIMKYRLELIKKHYTLERMVRTVGKNRKISIEFFKGADLSGDEDIRVKSGVDVFTNRKLKIDAVMTMMEKGMITDPRKALELMDLGKGLEEYMEDEFVDEQQATRYLEVMKNTDQYIEVDPDDANEVHFTVFNNFRKTEEFETLSDIRQDNIKQRIMRLKEITASEAAPTPTSAEKTTSMPTEEIAAPVEEIPPAPATPAPATPAPEAAPAGLPPEIASLLQLV
jgi:hypothetical protein